jgi:hypothetical protein
LDATFKEVANAAGVEVERPVVDRAPVAVEVEESPELSSW